MFLTQIVLINLNLVAQIIAVKDFIVCLIWTDFRCFFCNLANLRFIIATNISVGRDWSPKFVTGKMVVLWLFLAVFIATYILHKAEVQTIIFRCWTGLNLNWFKSYHRNTKKHKKTTKIKIFMVCVLTFEPFKIQFRSASQKDIFAVC